MAKNAGTSRMCPTLKAFSEKVGDILHCNQTNKYRKLDSKLEKKLVESIKKKSSLGKNNFRSINTIILRFPQFKESLRNIKIVFEKYDEDSNGVIDHFELRKCLNTLQIHLKEKEIADLFRSCDVNGDEGIQFNEFIVLLCLIYLHMEPGPSSDSTSKMGRELEATFNTVIEAFLFFDKNGDGKLNRKEMVEAMKDASSGGKSPRHITNTRFNELDAQKCGQVSFKEFLFALINWVGVDTNNDE